MARQDWGVQNPTFPEGFGGSDFPRAVYSVDEAAVFLRLDGSDIGGLVREGVLPWYKPPRTRIYDYVLRDDVEDYMRSRPGAYRWIPWPRFSAKTSLFTWQAAEYLQLSEAKIRTFVHRGHIRADDGGGQGSVFTFRVKDLDAAARGWRQFVGVARP